MSNLGPMASTSVRLHPFRAVRYDTQRTGDLSGVICPPYDDMPPAHARALRVGPHHLSRLLYADDPRTAAGQLGRWLERGVLRRDERPALYVYEQRDGERILQRGVIGELGFCSDPSSGPLPHEEVRPHEVGKHAALMDGLRAQLEPLLIAYRPSGPPLPRLMDQLVRRPPTDVARTGSATHRVWACADVAEQGSLVKELAAGRTLLADGHHRLAAIRHLRGSGERGFWSRALAMLVDTATYPLSLEPIHRVLPELDARKAAGAAADFARVTELPSGPREPQPGELVLTGQGRAWAVTDAAPEAVHEALSGQPMQWHQMPVAVADHLLIARAFSTPDLPGAIRHVHPAGRAVEEVAAVGGGTAVLVPRIPEAAVWELASQGVLLPRNSTAFGPKPAVGFAMRVAEGAGRR